MNNNLNKAIFLDRDGVLNYDFGYVHKIEDLKIFPGTDKALKIFKNLGYKLIIITNQSGVGRGYYTIEEVKEFNNELEKRLGIKFDDVYICPHTDKDNCNCRKPKIGNVLKAKEKFNIDLTKSYFVGDKESDIECGKNAGCKTVLIKSDKYFTNIKPDFKVNSLLEFAKILEG